ncbi:hypothetical protein ACFO3D_02595 [Virgibacillus kekensis]|uniref:Glycosyltransferase n=1 Tax=Virgibacillus kekensis TaxID=202261 RepID=A0ABV9DE55_9BACI
MSIHNVTSQQRISGTKVSVNPQQLKPGQIVQGKIIKIYPGNKAQIQLGTQKMVAQLEASLTIGERYHFQVQASKEVIQLKVIGDQLKNEARANIMSLMQQLGLKATKSNIAFMQALVKEGIPFTKDQLRKAFQLLDQAKNKSQAYTVLKNMIAARLPVTDSVFQALIVKKESGFGEQITNLTEQLRQASDSSSNRLLNRLHQVSGISTTIPNILGQVIGQDESVFNAMKLAGTIDPDVDFSSWKKEQPLVAQKNSSTSNADNVTQLEHLRSNRALIQTTVKAFLQKWGTVLNSVDTSLTGQQFSQMEQQITRNLMPLLSTEQQQNLSKLLYNQPQQMRQLLYAFQGLGSDQLYVSSEQLVSAYKSSDAFLQLPPKEQFLHHLQQVMKVTGLTYENMIAEGSGNQQSNTIKSLLIQMIQYGEGRVPDQAQQLLHYINGMQVQSVNESADFLQASLQLPAEKLGLAGDIQLDFEGKKNEDGKINPDFCRILFYLDLANLKETIIDMSIQKRSVTVTVYNDHGLTNSMVASLKPMVKEGLDKLDYQLSTVLVKPIHETKSGNNASHTYQQSYQGVDYRI